MPARRLVPPDAYWRPTVQRATADLGEGAGAADRAGEPRARVGADRQRARG